MKFIDSCCDVSGRRKEKNNEELMTNVEGIMGGFERIISN